MRNAYICKFLVGLLCCGVNTQIIGSVGINNVKTFGNLYPAELVHVAGSDVKLWSRILNSCIATGLGVTGHSAADYMEYITMNMQEFDKKIKLLEDDFASAHLSQKEWTERMAEKFLNDMEPGTELDNVVTTINDFFMLTDGADQNEENIKKHDLYLKDMLVIMNKYSDDMSKVSSAHITDEDHVSDRYDCTFWRECCDQVSPVESRNFSREVMLFLFAKVYETLQGFKEELLKLENNLLEQYLLYRSPRGFLNINGKLYIGDLFGPALYVQDLKYKNTNSASVLWNCPLQKNTAKNSSIHKDSLQIGNLADDGTGCGYMIKFPKDREISYLVINVYGGDQYTAEPAYTPAKLFENRLMEHLNDLAQQLKPQDARYGALASLNLADLVMNDQFQSLMSSSVYERVLIGIFEFVRAVRRGEFALEALEKRGVSSQGMLGIPRNVKIILYGASFGGGTVVNYLGKTGALGQVDGAISWNGSLDSGGNDLYPEHIAPTSSVNISGHQKPLLLFQALNDNIVFMDRLAGFLHAAERAGKSHLIRVVPVPTANMVANKSVYIGHFSKSFENMDRIYYYQMWDFINSLFDVNKKNTPIDDKRLQDLNIYNSLLKPEADESEYLLARLKLKRKTWMQSYPDRRGGKRETNPENALIGNEWENYGLFEMICAYLENRFDLLQYRNSVQHLDRGEHAFAPGSQVLREKKEASASLTSATGLLDKPTAFCPFGKIEQLLSVVKTTYRDFREEMIAVLSQAFAEVGLYSHDRAGESERVARLMLPHIFTNRVNENQILKPEDLKIRGLTYANGYCANRLVVSAYASAATRNILKQVSGFKQSDSRKLTEAGEYLMELDKKKLEKRLNAKGKYLSPTTTEEIWQFLFGNKHLSSLAELDKQAYARVSELGLPFYFTSYITLYRFFEKSVEGERKRVSDIFRHLLEKKAIKLEAEALKSKAEIPVRPSELQAP